MKFMIAALLFAAAVPSHATVSGKLDLSLNASIGAWQSVMTADQAFGVSKRVFYVEKDGQEVVHLGIFGGIRKPILTEPGSSPRAMAGLIGAVPGSLLDFALGTKMGDMWIPRLKTGVLVGYDLTRPKAMHATPDFVGIGASYLFGAL